LTSTLKESEEITKKYGVIGLVLELQGFKADLFALRLLFIFYFLFFFFMAGFHLSSCV
jgi:hypothetical protein